MEDEALITVLAEAAEGASEHGAVLRTDNPERLRQRLYALMKTSGFDFRLTIPNTEGELWLLRKS